MIQIVQKNEKVLRQKAKEIPVAEINTPKIKSILKDMGQALESQDDGVAIAAPQIGVGLRIFVVSGRVFDPEFDEAAKGKKKVDKKALLERKEKFPDVVFINPKITKLSKKKKYVPEGCLSVRWLYGEVNRSTNATIEAYDESGIKFTRGAGGLLAQIFQHETDHLDGILFIDKADNLQEMPPEKLKNE